MSSDDIPRRIRIDLNTPAELAIRAAMYAVEALPADARLTDAVVLLDKAREKVADYVDNTGPAPVVLPKPAFTPYGFRPADGITNAGFEAW